MTLASESAAQARAGQLAAWCVVLAGVSAALHVGKLAPALPALRAALQLDLLQAGFLLSTVQLAGMSLGLLIGLMADGLGLRRSMLCGLALLCAASAVGAGAASAWLLLALRALEGLGFLLVAMPAPGLIRQLVPASALSRMLGLWGAYMPAGTALALLVGPLWIASATPWGGWPGWWVLLSVVSGAMALLVWRLVPPERLRAPALQAQSGAWLQRLRQTLGHRGPWLVALCFAMYSGQWLAVVGFLPSVYAQSGLSAGWTGLLTAAVAGANMVGNVASGRLLQRGWAAARLLNIGYLTMALGALVCFNDFGAAWMPAPALRFAAVLVFSGVGGLIPGTLFSLAMRVSPGESTVSTTVGWMQQLSALGQFSGPPLVAWVAQSAGGWQWTWLATGTCSLAGLALARLLARMLALRR